MELTKVILLSCSLLVSFSKGDDTTTVTENQEQLEQTSVSNVGEQKYGLFRRFNKLTNNLRQCFCFLQKSAGVPVTHRLNPSGDKLERLVVYLYKDESSDDLKIYLPNYEKQLMIPDLVLDKGDVLETVPSDEIKSMFNKYPYLKTNRDYVDIPDIAQIIDPVPLNQNLNVPDTFDEEKSSIDLKPTPMVNNNAASPSEQQLNLYTHSQISPDEDQVSQDGKGYDDFSDLTNIYPYTQLPNDSIEYVTEESNPDRGLDSSPDSNKIIEDLKENAEKVVQINQNFYLNTEPGIPINNITKDNTAVSSGENNFNINLDMSSIDEDKTERPPKIDVMLKPNQQDLTSVPQVEVENPETIQYEHYITSPELPNSNNIPMPTNPLIWNTINPQYIPAPTNIKKIINYVPERKTINTIPTESPKIWHNNIYDSNDRKILTLHPQRLIQKFQNTEPNEINLQDTFDNWLVHQLERVQFADSEASNSIDIYTLKYLIEETLQKNGFFIAQNGLLVDSKGVKIHMANLVLRPILIGNSVEYKKLLKGKVSTFKLPTDLPYLEAVLVTSIKPQKIFGIVPLGKTFLPKDYRTPLSLYVQDLRRGGCNRCNENRGKSRQFYQTGYIPSRVQQYYNQYPSNWLTTNYNPFVKKQSYGLNQVIPTPYTAIQRDGFVEGSRRVFPFDQVNTFIDKLYKVPLSIDKIKYVDRPYVVQPVMPTETYQTIPIVKYPVNVVTPGFRIIGGNAATSSGTPVSSKGRSGIEPEEVKSIDEE